RSRRRVEVAYVREARRRSSQNCRDAPIDYGQKWSCRRRCRNEEPGGVASRRFGNEPANLRGTSYMSPCTINRLRDLRNPQNLWQLSARAYWTAVRGTHPSERSASGYSKWK